MSKDPEIFSEDDLQALHQSIEQLNSGNLSGCIAEPHETSGRSSANSSLNNKRKKSGRGGSQETADVQTQTPKKKGKRRRVVPVPEELLEEENPIDEILEEIAQRKNLTTQNVKHLLRNIIAHESVQEMLKLSLDSSDPRMPFEPKLTRSKTKEWLETQNLTAYPPSARKATGTTQSLMEEELLEDSSDDDEYRPNEEDQSDEESFLSSHASDIALSDIGSPSVPAPPTPQSDELFKRPLPVENGQQGETDLIGSRTRSKLPLNDTPLEHLELAFLPPDISTDMYDSECDDDEWRNFLKEYVCPTTTQSAEHPDDEEADPEYNVLEEEEEVDDEELRADRTVQITKKEVSELLSELFEADLVSSSDDEAPPPPAPEVPPVPTAAATPSKPTGIVQPLTPTPSPPQEGVAFTVSFPTLLNCPAMEFVAPTAEPAIQGVYPDSPPATSSGLMVLPLEAQLLFEEQMRKHVQLLTQMHLITAQQEELTSVAQECRAMLGELLPLAQRGWDISNVEEAVQLTDHWASTVEKIPAERLKGFQREVVTTEDNKTKFRKFSSRHPDRFPFHPRMVDLMADSRVFIYPWLLPKVAIFQVLPGPCIPSVHEEQLIAMGLEQFSPFCAGLLAGTGKGTASQTQSLVHSMISHYMMPQWSGKKIGWRIKRLLRAGAPANPVKYYAEHGMAPPVIHSFVPFNRYAVPKLRDVPLSSLPVRWRELLAMSEVSQRSRRKSVYAIRPSVPLSTSTPSVPTKTAQKRRPKRPLRALMPPDSEPALPSTPSHYVIVYGTDQAVPQPVPPVLEEKGSSPSQSGSPEEVVQLTEGDEEASEESAGSESEEEDDDLTIDESGSIPEEMPLEEPPAAAQNTSGSSTQTAKRYVLIRRTDSDAMHVWGPDLKDLPIRTAADNETAGSGAKDRAPSLGPNPSDSGGGQAVPSGESGGGGTVGGSSGGDDGDKPPPSSSPIPGHSADDLVPAEDDEEEEDNVTATPSSSAQLSAPSKAGRSPAHRQMRHQRNARRILDSWMAEEDPGQPRSDTYAQIYFLKVRNQLEPTNPAAFREFVTTLGHFQSSSSSTLELYRKMERILGASHPDLMEEFVLFLSAEEAAQCGVSFQHFLYVRMREFFTKLKIHFKDSPSQLKRVLKTLQAVESSPSPRIGDLKSAVLPLVRGNAHLSLAFLQLFPDDAPPPSETGDFEEISMEQLNVDEDFEYVQLTRDSETGGPESGGGAAPPTGEGKRRPGAKGVNKAQLNKGKSWKKSTSLS